MAKFVVAGKSGCPFYARAELLADELVLKLPNFNVHKIVLNSSEWDEWISSTCTEKGWTFSGNSPIVWRELINRGGKGTLLGGCNEFLEYAKGYYGITSDKTSDTLNSIAKENKETKNVRDDEEQKRQEAIKPFRIAVVGAENPLAYHVLPSIVKGDFLEETEELAIQLHYDDAINDHVKNQDNGDDVITATTTIDGLVMELQDCANAQVRSIDASTDLLKSFDKANIVIILNLSTDLNKDSVSYLKKLALTLKKTINEETKVIFIGENSIICCNIIHYFLNGIARNNLMAMTRFEENIVKSALSRNLEINSAGIENLIVWGSTKEYVVDYNCATAYGYNGAIWAPHIETFSHQIKEIAYDKKFLENDLPQLLNNREKSMQSKLLSFSAAVTTQLKDLLSSSSTNINVYSLGVISDGSYDIPEGLIYSFPVRYSGGDFSIADNIECSETVKESIKRTASELQGYCNELIALEDPSVLKKILTGDASKDYLDVITSKDHVD